MSFFLRIPCRRELLEINMEKSLEELNGKIRTLKFRMGKTENVILTRDKEALDRQLISVSAISTIVNTLKETIEENMFLQNKTEEQLKDWASEPELMLAQADQCIRRINSELKSVETAANEAITQKEEERKLEFERRLTEQKLQQEKQATEEKRKLDFEHLKTMQEVEQSASRQTSNPAPTTAKMPKLVITKLAGTPQDWVRFWGQFDSQINKSAVDEVTKFSYLKELVEIKVRKLIDGLPLTSEGYLKAVHILKKRYGQPSEVVSAYVKAILELPTIKERDVAKIHQFYETLLFNVESLQTLGQARCCSEVYFRQISCDKE